MTTRTSLLLSLVFAAAAAQAIPPDVRLDQLHHAKWTLADGAPGVARAMAQTADGALWQGTETGLYRFDGMRFQRVQVDSPDLPLDNVSALAATPDGGLWIGRNFGGVYFWKAGSFTAEGLANGLPAERSVRTLAMGPDGRLWAGTTDGMFVREQSRWRPIHQALGHPGGYVFDMVFDPQHTLWMAGSSGVYSLPRGESRVRRHGDAGSLSFVTVDREGSGWLSTLFDTGGELRPIGAASAGSEKASIGFGYAPGSWGSRAILDRDGGLWFAHSNGLMRLSRPSMLTSRWLNEETGPPASEHFGVPQGLSGADAHYIFEDRDGHIWVSTDAGLDRFKLPRVRPHGNRLAHGSLGLTDAGALLICALPGGMHTLDGPVAALKPLGAGCDAMVQEPSGRRWFAMDRQIWWWHQGQTGKLPHPPDVDPVLSVPALEVDAEGALWASFIRKGLYRHLNGRWTWFEPGKNGFPTLRPVSMGRDRNGRVWLGYTHSHVAVVEGTAARNWGPGEGLRVGAVSVIVPTDDGMLIGGTEGLALLVDGNVTMLQDASGERLDTVGGIVQSSDGDWWIHAGKDVVRLTPAALAQARSGRDHRVTVERFGPWDGLRGSATALYPSPSAARTSDGRLWFTTPSALHVVDPARLQRNTRAPAVELRGLRAEGDEQALSSPKALPVGTRRIEFSFAAVHLSAPERVRYRYQLSGVDSNWQYTTDRSATYTNLAPGDYVFRMSAANEDGVWNDEGASTRFTIPPAFHQTAWFYVLCTMALGGLAGTAYLIRVRQITARVRLRAEAQARERERIARDLHDTLLQSTHGLMLSVQALADRTPAGHPDKARIERALEHADRAVLEGRQKVLDLRTEDTDSDGVLLLEALVQELVERGPAGVTLRVEGTPRHLAADARSELLQVAREALVNAQRHARAQQIDVTLAFTAAALALRVEDDGVGMPSGLMDGSQTAPGRLGLTGLRERAAVLGASLSIRRGARGGSLVEMCVPAARAYKPSGTGATG